MSTLATQSVYASELSFDELTVGNVLFNDVKAEADLASSSSLVTDPPLVSGAGRHFVRVWFDFHRDS